MSRPSKKQRRSRSNVSAAHDYQRKTHEWKKELLKFDNSRLHNQKGKVRSYAENKLIIASLKMLLTKEMQRLGENSKDILSLNWTSLENDVATYLHVGKAYVRQLRQEFLGSGEILIFGDVEKGTVKRGKAADNYKQERMLDREQLCDLINEVDKNHALGKTVTNLLMRNYIRYKHQIDLSRTTMRRYFISLGLTWKPVKAKKRNVGNYRMDLLRDYLIKFDKLYKEFIKDEENCPFVFVFTDESYIHRNHSKEKTYLREGCPDFNGKSSNGERLVIMHAITHKGVLAEKVDGHYVTDTEWKGTKQDTPHSENRDDDKLTCETIWKASSNTGDYHDNMNSEMFMNWVNKKLIPTFKKLHPDKTMVLVCDNAAYHHCREIGSFGSSTKNQMVDLCIKHNVEYIDVPATDRRIAAMNAEVSGSENVMLAGNNMIRVLFDEDTFRETASNRIPFVPNLDELKLGVIGYLQEHNPSMLECKVTTLMKEHGHTILWTPPYSPHLQPIELFWAAGKNHAASMAHFDSTLYETVWHLRHGWYGNSHLFQGDNRPEDYRVTEKSAVDCRKLFNHCVHNANTMSIPLCAGLSGSIGNLVIDEDHEANVDGMPIDIMLLNIGSAVVEGQEASLLEDEEDESDDDIDEFD